MRRIISKTGIFMFMMVSGILSLSGQPGPGAGVPWWLQSSLLDSNRSLRFHEELKINASRMFGAYSSQNQSLMETLVIRKGIVTNQSIYHYQKMDNDMAGVVIKRTAHFFTDFLVADITPSISAQCGFIWERDDAMYLENRYTVYAGGGMNKTFWSKLTLDNLVALGWLKQNYTIPVTGLDVVKEPYKAIFLRQNYHYTMGPKASVSGQLFYFGNLDDMSRYRWGGHITVNLNLVKWVNLVVGYNYTYDREMYLLGIDPENGSQNMGLQFSL